MIGCRAGRRRGAPLALLLSLALIAQVALPPSAAAAVLDSSERGFTIESSVHTDADAARSWRALTRDVGRWWLSEHTWWGRADRLRIEARAGGCFCEKSGSREAEHLRVVMVSPHKLLRMNGGLGPLQGMGFSGVLEFRLAADDAGGTRITLHYRVGGYSDQDPRGLAPAVDAVLSAQLQALTECLREPKPRS